MISYYKYSISCCHDGSISYFSEQFTLLGPVWFVSVSASQADITLIAETVLEQSVELFLLTLKDRRWNVESAVNTYFAQLASANSGPDVTVV